MDLGRAAKDLSGAVDELIKRSGSGKVGVVGFCMGGGLALWLSCLRGDAITACVPFYGAIPWPDAQPDYSKIRAAVQGHYAENDGWAGPAAVNALEETLRPLGYGVEMHLYQGAEHAFFNDTRPEVYDPAAAADAWKRVTSMFQSEVPVWPGRSACDGGTAVSAMPQRVMRFQVRPVAWLVTTSGFTGVVQVTVSRDVSVLNAFPPGSSEKRRTVIDCVPLSRSQSFVCG